MAVICSLFDPEVSKMMSPSGVEDSSSSGAEKPQSGVDKASDSGEKSEPSALDQRMEELLTENLQKRKGALADGQEIAEVRQAVEDDFQISTKGEEFELVKELENEVKEKDKKEDFPSAFNEIKDFSSKVQDGKGGKGNISVINEIRAIILDYIQNENENSFSFCVIVIRNSFFTRSLF